MKILVDTNVFLDVLMARPQWQATSRQVLDWCDTHPGNAWIAWHTLSNLYYIGTKSVGAAAAQLQISQILDVFEVAMSDTNGARKALELGMPDFEYALQAVSAQCCAADAIVSRNVKDFQSSPVKALTPAQFVHQIQNP